MHDSGTRPRAFGHPASPAPIPQIEPGPTLACIVARMGHTPGTRRSWVGSCLSLALGFVGPTAGCYGQYVPPPQSGASSTSDVAEESTAGAQSSTASIATSTDDATDAAPTIRDGDPTQRCHVDILVVVDFSVSMGNYLTTLLDAVFGLINVVPAQLEMLESFHLGVTTTAGVPWNVDSSLPFPEGDDCTGPGSLVRPQGIDCARAFEQRPFLNQDSDIDSALTCLIQPLFAATTSENPDLEGDQIFGSITGAVLNTDLSPNPCNAGFHATSDALLIILVTDADDASNKSPAELATSLLAATDANPERLAMTVIAGDPCGRGWAPP